MTDDPKWQELGMVPGVPGHYLEEDDANTHPGDTRFHLKCTCGFQIWGGNLTKAGKLGARPRRNWRDHLDGVTSAEEVVPIARIFKKRGTIDVIVMSPTYSKLGVFTFKQVRFALNRDAAWVRQNGFWAVGLEKSNGEKIFHGTYPTRADAIDSATRWCRQQEGAAGVRVEYAVDGAHFNAPTFGPQASFAALLDEVDACLAGGDLAMYAETSQHLEDALRLLPILQAKHKIFLNRRATLFGM